VSAHKRIGRCDGVPAPTSPISHAVVAGNVCWISGQHALDVTGAYERGSATKEAQRCLELVGRIAECAGFSRDDIVFVDISFADLADLQEVNSVFEQFFAPEQRPARAISQVAALSFGARLKISATASRARARTSRSARAQDRKDPWSGP